MSDLPRNIGKPATRALAAEGITRLDQLPDRTESELLKLHSMGPKALGRLREALSEQGKSFASEGKMKTYHGSCHCGEIRFELNLDLTETAIRKCNCSFCLKSGYKKALVGYDALRITAGEDRLQNYHAKESNWPDGDIDHYRCPTCGMQPFSRGYLEEMMGGNFWAVNVACLDDVTEEELAAAPVIYEDGMRDRQDQEPEITSYL